VRVRDTESQGRSFIVHLLCSFGETELCIPKSNASFFQSLPGGMYAIFSSEISRIICQLCNRDTNYNPHFNSSQVHLKGCQFGHNSLEDFLSRAMLIVPLLGTGTLLKKSTLRLKKSTPSPKESNGSARI